MDTPDTPKHVDDISKRAFRRARAIEELLTTEETYVKQLKLLLVHYVDMLNDYKIIKEKDFNKLFPNDLRTICNLNSQLLKDLQDRIASPDKQNNNNDNDNNDNDNTDNNDVIISDILLKFAPYFR